MTTRQPKLHLKLPQLNKLNKLNILNVVDIVSLQVGQQHVTNSDSRCCKNFIDAGAITCVF